jgi:DNA-binding NarL/FixJ family response regulator
MKAMSLEVNPLDQEPPTTRSPAVVSVALVEDDAGMRGRLSAAIGAEPSLRLAFAEATATGLLARLAGEPVDVLLVDLGLPDGSGLALIRRCRAVWPACAVMVITMFGDETTMRAAFAAGASGYLLKDGTLADLAAAVLSLHAGGSPMSPLIARQLLTDWRRTASQSGAADDAVTTSSRVETLSPREAQVLEKIARGFTYGEIAADLGVALSTVQSHVKHLYTKLDVRNKTEAVLEARQLGWLR